MFRISWPDDALVYNRSLYGSQLVGLDGHVTHENQIGPSVSHVYEITNRGPSVLRRAQVLLLWPSRTLAEEPLLYLTRTPSVEPQLTCLPMDDLNHLDIEVSLSIFVLY